AVGPGVDEAELLSGQGPRTPGNPGRVRHDHSTGGRATARGAKGAVGRRPPAVRPGRARRGVKITRAPRRQETILRTTFYFGAAAPPALGGMRAALPPLRRKRRRAVAPSSESPLN